MKRLENLHATYNRIRAALPWLDCYVSDLPCRYPGTPGQQPPTAFRQLDFTTTNPRLVRQTDHSFEEIEQMATDNPGINYIIVSGEKKMLYHFSVLERLLSTHANLYLATSNVCNEFALERLIAKGLSAKLLYGSMMPCFDAGNTLGMIVLGKMDWETKCAIAGNNFRRLLGEPPVSVPEIAIPEIAPFMVDAHSHTTSDKVEHRFPPYHSEPEWPLWQEKINSLWVEDMFVTPDESILKANEYTSREIVGDFCRDSHGHALYFEVFDPRYAEHTANSLEKALPDPLCIGIKIHPVEHRIEGSDPRYDIAFQKAAKYGKPIMTHSWGLSDYNPNQRFATPDQFAVHLENHPEVAFVFGHTGGRPNGFRQAVEMAKRFPQARFDLAGDIFHYGFLYHDIREIGTDRMLFASDSYWIDERCMLGMLFESGLPDAELWKVLRTNALEFYHPAK